MTWWMSTASPVWSRGLRLLAWESLANHKPQATCHKPHTTNYDNVPALHVDGQELFLKWPKEEGNG